VKEKEVKGLVVPNRKRVTKETLSKEKCYNTGRGIWLSKRNRILHGRPGKEGGEKRIAGGGKRYLERQPGKGCS